MLPEGHRRHARFCLELCRKIIAAAKSCFQSDFRDGFSALREQDFCVVDAHIADIFRKGYAELGMKQARKIGRGQAGCASRFRKGKVLAVVCFDIVYGVDHGLCKGRRIHGGSFVCNPLFPYRA